MDHTPRYYQPFTLGQVLKLDVGTIAEEITRLQNSLKHLQETQDMLRELIATESQPDPDFTTALNENEETIGSQTERITILKTALSDKGVLSGSHYDLATDEPKSTSPSKYDPSPPTQASGDEETEGVYL